MTTGQQIFQDRIARLEKKHADNNGRPVAEQPPSGMDMAPSDPTPQARSKPRGGAARFIAVLLLAVIALPASAFFGTMFYQNNKDMILGGESDHDGAGDRSLNTARGCGGRALR